MKQPRTPHALLDTLIQSNKLRSDTHLADELEVSKITIHDIRHGRRYVSADIRCTIIRKFGMSLKKIDELAPPKKEGA